MIKAIKTSKVLLQPPDQRLRAVHLRRVRREREQLPREAGVRGHLQEGQRVRVVIERAGEDTGGEIRRCQV